MLTQFKQHHQSIPQALLQDLKPITPCHSELKANLERFYRPDLSGNFEHFYGSIPNSEYFRLFVDVSKQKDLNEWGYVWL